MWWCVLFCKVWKSLSSNFTLDLEIEFNNANVICSEAFFICCAGFCNNVPSPTPAKHSTMKHSQWKTLHHNTTHHPYKQKREYKRKQMNTSRTTSKHNTTQTSGHDRTWFHTTQQSTTLIRDMTQHNTTQHITQHKHQVMPCPVLCCVVCACVSACVHVFACVFLFLFVGVICCVVV